MLPYPAAMPTDAIQSLIAMITTRTFDKDNFALALWNVQGYAQGKIFSSPMIFGSEPLPDLISDDRVVEALNQVKETNPNFVGANPLSNMALKIILKWAFQKALELL